MKVELPDGLVLRAMRPEDAEAALALSEEAGWNQNVADWRFMLTEGRGLGVREPGGAWAASSLVLPQGPRVAWISMVLVARRHRRQGLGTLLLKRSIEAAQAAGLAPGLDATELGRPVYLPLGFRDLYPISRWRLPAVSALEPPAGCAIRPMTGSDLPAVAAYDAARTGTERSATLRYLQGRAAAAACVAKADGRIVGYALGRPGRMTPHLGAIVADDSAVALALISRIAALGLPAILDMPDAHGAVADWLKRHGAVRERGFTRMVRGDGEALDPRAIYALAGPELS